MADEVKQPLRSLAPISWPQPRAAYVHLPFCVHRCHYCDFAVVAGREADADRYLDALEAEIKNALSSSLSPLPSLHTLFLGGGTPTQLTAPQLERLFNLLRQHLPLSLSAEVSVEANPDGLCDAKVEVLRKHGVTRVSLGVQSFRPELLRFLERRHTAAEAIAVVERLLPWFEEVSVDLIFGVPGQSLADWEADLRLAVELGVGHVSTYGLTYEKGTRLWKAKEKGLTLPLAEELEADQYALAMDRLAAAGFEHYELSNFARPGHRCRHNETYWANQPHLGFGLGAARYLAGVRAVNTRSFDGYLKSCLAGADPTQSHEELSPEERARETAMLNLRRLEGIGRAEFFAQTGHRLDALAAEAIRRSTERGLLADTGARLALTRAGKFVADGVMGDVLCSISVAPPERRSNGTGG